MDTESRNRYAWITLFGGCCLLVIAAVVSLAYFGSPGRRQPASASTNTTPTGVPSDAATDDTTASGGNGVMSRFANVVFSIDSPSVEKCTISSILDVDSVGPDVLCLESTLANSGAFSGVPDTRFDSTTAAAVSDYQRANGLEVDGVAGPQTTTALGIWVVPEPDPSTCASEGRSAVIDRQFQRTWLCEDGSIVRTMPVTSSSAQPDPGSYRVTEKDMNATSEFSGDFTRMTHFVVFAEGKFSGARVGFHSVPTHDDGSFVQPLDSVGNLGLIGESSGCIRAIPDDATAIWDFLAIDDSVTVIS